MRIERIWIPGRLPSLNELMLDRGMRVRGKKTWCKTVAMIAQMSGCKPWPDGACVHIECVEPNQKRDPDGFSSGAAKVILDALQHAGVLGGDGWKHVKGLSYSWRVDKEKPGVMVTLREPEPVSLPASPPANDVQPLRAGRRRV